MARMLIADPGKTRVIEYNGQPEERAVVKAEFEALMASGLFLAYVVDEKTNTNTMTTDFPEEAEKIVLTPRLVGG